MLHDMTRSLFPNHARNVMDPSWPSTQFRDAVLQLAESIGCTGPDSNGKLRLRTVKVLESRYKNKIDVTRRMSQSQEMIVQMSSLNVSTTPEPVIAPSLPVEEFDRRLLDAGVPFHALENVKSLMMGKIREVTDASIESFKEFSEKRKRRSTP
jgi:hypothetical protein